MNELEPLLLGSNVRDDNTVLTVDLTNPDIFSGDQIVLQKDTLHIVRTTFIWRNTAYQRLGIRNHGMRPVGASDRASLRQRFRGPVRGARTEAQAARMDRPATVTTVIRCC